MSEFNEIPVGTYLKLTSGFPFASEKFSDEGFPLIRIRDVLTSKTETYFNGPFPPGYVIKKGDILIGMDGDFHVVKWFGCDALLNQRVLKVNVFNESNVILDYVFHWLKPFIKKINDITAATTVKHLSVKDIFKAKAKFPSVSVQQRIAIVLTNIDTVIEKTEALIDKYQQIKTGLMHDLFTRGVLPNGKLRPQRDQAPEMYQETSIGWVPSDWDIQTIGKTLESISDGPFGSNLKTEHYVVDPGVRVVRLQNVAEYVYSDRDKAYISDRHARFLLRNKIIGGDVLIAGLGEERYPVGRACIYPLDLPPAINKADCFRARCNPATMKNKFFMLFLNSEMARRQIRRYEQGVTRPRINTGNMKRLSVCIPSIDEQVRIIEKFESIQLKISIQHTNVNKLNQQKHGLMQDLLTGKVSVKVEKQIAESVDG
ncbi:restriction endonuclease subunit S [Undibacterium sp. Ren11W]|uniref:restriction endonuclease subunit S n=1 Tax=Undibacterium sp. Ren11W TaxID=3413045 RepID=UPI003BF01EEB